MVVVVVVGGVTFNSLFLGVGAKGKANGSVGVGQP